MTALAVKRYGPLRRGRYQKRFDTEEAAIAAAERWFKEGDVKAVWVFGGPENAELLHRSKATESAGTS